MKYKLVVKAEAVQDITEAFEWYENQRTGLGTEFLDEVEKFFDRIKVNPLHHQSNQNQHVAVMHRFPYKVVFEIEGEMIVVYAVYHDKRNPQELSER